MGKGKKLIFDAGLVFFIGILASVIGYFIRVILSKQLSLEEFGLFYSVFVFVSFFVVFRDFGLSNALMKFIPEFLVKKKFVEIKSSIKFVIVVNLIVTSIISLIFILLSSFLSEKYFKNDLAKPVLIILSFYFILNAIYRVLITIFVGFQRTKLYASELLLINLLALIGILIFSKFGVISPAIAYLVATTIGVIIGSIILSKTFNFSKYQSNLSNKLKSKLLNYGFPLLLAAVGFIIIGQIDTLILTGFRSLAEVGIYNVVLPTAMLVISLGSSISLVMLPLTSEYWSRKKISELTNIIKEIYKKVFVLIVPAGLVLFVFSDFILKILFGSDFIAGSSALKILLIGTILFSVATINNNIISAIGKPKIVTKTILIGALANIILNLILIPRYGINGAAIATTIAYIFILILSSYNIGKFIKIKIPILGWSKTFIAGISFVFVIALLKRILEMNIWLETFIVLVSGALIYSALILSMKVVTLKEVTSLLKK